ncbi:DNA circularization N-terminal domain-containing protein [Hansschlegelia zhihuaiae]|uniref:DNA circulation N-terminal domain-containing protein n=1 Tax=Hansschlegelia zhihuaiae TaxID=405005 RepID=A0A4V1KHM2_9HYPH|nr:DNA circularization N-terminal domain-containing protein [Hansschlegelia zhihuaiae]RXF67682.1 hypothetical protein EK403_20995 [Hansschlegelia zhihuaiae]
MMGVDRVRDWPRTLPQASFKGFFFHVEGEGVDDAGRFVAVHPFVKAEDHATEDLGRKPRRYTVRAYVVGNLADARSQDLIEVCSSPEAGLLVLPMTGSMLARCVSCSTDSRKDVLGFVAFSLSFVEAGLETGGFPAIEILDRIAEEALLALPDIANAILSRRP